VGLRRQATRANTSKPALGAEADLPAEMSDGIYILLWVSNCLFQIAQKPWLSMVKPSNQVLSEELRKV
jgi:hypothetical protein